MSLRFGRGRAARPAPAAPCRVLGRWTTLAISMTLASAALAQQGQQIMPNYRDADIRQVIEAVGAVTGRNFSIDPRVRAQVTLLSFSPMTPEAFYQAFLSMLQVHGYVALDSSGGVTNIVPDANARQWPGAGDDAEGAEIVTQTIPLTNIGAAQLVPILRPLQPQYAHLAAAQGSNMLIIADRADNVERLVSIIERVDRAADEDIEVISLENAAASEVVQMLGSLAQSAAAAGGAPTAQLVADERTNSVLLSGSATSRLRYRALIAHLDTPSEAAGDTRVIYLRYADATELAESLRTQFTGAAAAEGAPPGQSGEVTIWADQGTNALVVNAPARILQDMLSVIEKIDIRRAQVQVDAIIVELGEQKAAELGVTWAIDGAGGDAAIGVTNFGIGTGILQLAAPALGEGGQLDPSAIPQGITAGLGNIRDAGTSWAMIINALRGDAQTNVLSTPTIVTLDNEEAEIRVGQEVPFVTGQFTNTGAAQGSVNPFTTIQREEIGTLLKITPQINEGSGVRLTIEQNQSSLSAQTGAADLITNTRTILTSVFVEDGDILVLGGLLDDTIRESEQRVPVLGKVPGLGWLFRSRSTERQKVNLTVFIRPTILRDGAQARFQTNTKYNFLRDLQQQQAEEPVQLMREENYPILPELSPQQLRTSPPVIAPVAPPAPEGE